MNTPYVKRYTLNDKGESVIANPIPSEGYINQFPNRRARRAFLHQGRNLNSRKGRYYYQIKMKPVYTTVVDEHGNSERTIAYSVPTRSTIAHRVR